MGTIKSCRARVRDLVERFGGWILLVFERRTEEVFEIVPRLHCYGLSRGGFDLALRGFFRQGARLSGPFAIAALSLGLVHGLSFLPVCWASEFVNLIPNQGFEEDEDLDNLPDGWKQVASTYGERDIRWRTGGREGRAISVRGRGVGGWQAEVRGIVPGGWYLFSMWVKRDGFVDGEYPAFEVFDQKVVISELFSSHGWVRYSWFLKAGRKESTTVILSGNGMGHRAWFDDIELRRFDVRLLEPLDGVLVSTQRPRFRWEMPKTDHVLELRLELSTKKSFDEVVVVPHASPLGATLKVADPLEPGTWYWRVTAWKNRQEIAKSETGAFRIETGTTAETPLDRVSAVRSPIGPSSDELQSPHAISKEDIFFPIGIFGAPVEAFGELSEAGFNCVQSYSRDPDYVLQYVESARQNGLKALVRIPQLSTTVERVGFLRGMADEEAILGWYLEDEPEGRGVSPAHLWLRNNALHLLDPKHPSALTLVRSNKAWDYGPSVDVLMVDPYPIPKMPVTWLGDSIDEARRAVFDEKPVWAVVQAFDWSYYSEEHRRDGSGRNPTYEEERCLTYLSIVHGAKGIFYFAYDGGSYHIKDHPEHWLEVKRIVAELQWIYPLLLAPEVQESFRVTVKSFVPAEELESSRASGSRQFSPLHYVVREVREDSELSSQSPIRPGRYLIAVNASASPLDVFLHLDSFTRVLPLLRQQPYDQRGNQVVCHLQPYDVHIYLLRRNYFLWPMDDMVRIGKVDSFDLCRRREG